MIELLKEFKPALLFLGKFLAIYFVGNICYGVFIESYGDSADPVTRLVGVQSSYVLNVVGYESGFDNVPGAPKVALRQGDYDVLHIYEGCNGLNVMIVFVAFLFAFGGPLKAFWVFLPIGLFVIHLFNLLRITLLYYLVLNNSSQFYYYHKYFFTAILYVVVFGLWAVWVIRLNGKRNLHKAAA